MRDQEPSGLAVDCILVFTISVGKASLFLTKIAGDILATEIKINIRCRPVTSHVGKVSNANKH